MRSPRSSRFDCVVRQSAASAGRSSSGSHNSRPTQRPSRKRLRDIKLPDALSVAHPCSVPSRSEPARCRLLHDFAHTMSRRRGPHASCPEQGFRRPLWSYHSEPPIGPPFPRRCMRPQGHERVEGPICASEAEPHWWNRKHAQRKPAPACGGRPSHLRPEIESPGSASSRLREWAPSRRRCFVERPGVRHCPRISCSPQSTQ